MMSFGNPPINHPQCPQKNKVCMYRAEQEQITIKKKGGTRARRFLEKSIKPERLRGKGGEKDGKEDRIQRVAGVPGGEESEMRGLMKGSSSGKKDLKKRREIRKGRARLNFTATQTSNYIHKLDKR